MSLVLDGTSGVPPSAHPFLVGQVCTFAMATPPSGFIKCNGAAVSRTTYAALFAAVGTAYGIGDGSTTFNVPDLRGEFLRGWDDARGVDSGRTIGTAQTDALQGHSHTVTTFVSGGWGGSTGWITQSPTGSVTTDPTMVTNGTNGTPRSASETRPRNVALMVAIFTGV